MGIHAIAAVLADIDGTMVTKDKVLTERTILAVNRLRERGIVFTICSSRSPRVSTPAKRPRTSPATR